jgi:hypothetical protein
MAAKLPTSWVPCPAPSYLHLDPRGLSVGLGRTNTENLVLLHCLWNGQTQPADGAIAHQAGKWLSSRIGVGDQDRGKLTCAADGTTPLLAMVEVRRIPARARHFRRCKWRSRLPLTQETERQDQDQTSGAQPDRGGGPCFPVHQAKTEM